MRQLTLDFTPPTSAPLRIPDGRGGQLWLKPNSLRDGNPIYEKNAELDQGFVDKTQDQDEVWRKAEAYHNRERAA